MRRITNAHQIVQQGEVTKLVRLVQEHAEMLGIASREAKPRKIAHAANILAEAVRVLANTNTKGDRFGRLAEGVRIAAEEDGVAATNARVQLEVLRDDFHHPDAEAILNKTIAFEHFVSAVTACREGKKKGYRNVNWEENGRQYWIYSLHECLRLACREARSPDTEAGYVEDFSNDVIE